MLLVGDFKHFYDYVSGRRLDNRSALEWIVDQYQVSTDKRSGITTKPRRRFPIRPPVDGQVVTVRVETVGFVQALSRLSLAG